MYISELKIRNFRSFSDDENIIEFNPGLNVLVGENDSGKSAILDAIRLVLGTTDLSWNAVEEKDFFNEDTSREILIVLRFSDLSETEKATFLEYLTYEEGNTYLYLYWSCRYISVAGAMRPISKFATGKTGIGQRLSSEVRELLRVTYLKALRDAYSDLRAKRHSRLSQILQNVPEISSGEEEYREGTELNELSLLALTDLYNKLLSEHKALRSVNCNMSETLNKKLLLSGDQIETKFEVSDAKDKAKRKIALLLEKLDLVLEHRSGKVGLGTSNLLSIACELLLHKQASQSGNSLFLLIEEPESHIHAQRQLKLVQSLQESSEKFNQQIIVTTHSPLLASVVNLKNIIIVKNSKTYPLSEVNTKLDKDDYEYLERYLDATKANLFFARSVMIVEGPGEELLFPTIARLLGKSFTDFGVSLVDVRGVGLRRYARIFQRSKESDVLDIRVACVTDRDIMPDCAPSICINEDYTTDNKSKWPPRRRWKTESDLSEEQKKEHEKALKQKADGQLVKTFISNNWTLEYDLAYVGLKDDQMKKILIDSLTSCLSGEDVESHNLGSMKSLDAKSIEERASEFYKFFMTNRVSKPEFAQKLAKSLIENYYGKPQELRKVLPLYICEAIDYVTSNFHD